MVKSGSLLAKYVDQLSKTRRALMETFSNSRIIGITEKMEEDPSEPKAPAMEIPSPKMSSLTITDTEKLKSLKQKSTCKEGDTDPKCRDQQVVYINLRPAKIFLDPGTFFNLFNLFLEYDYANIVKKRWLELEPQAFKIFKEETKSSIQEAISSGRLTKVESENAENSSTEENKNVSNSIEKMTYVIEGMEGKYQGLFVELYKNSPWKVEQKVIGNKEKIITYVNPTSEILYKVYICYKSHTDNLNGLKGKELSTTERVAIRISSAQDYIRCLDKIQ
jgi:hypothetical protein